MAPIAAPDITVTTATRTADDVAQTLGPDARVVRAPAESGESAEPTAAITPEQEAASATPDLDVSDAARTLRAAAGRLSDRKKRLTDEIALYEDSIRQLGGTVAPVAPRSFAKPQDEIDALARRRGDLGKTLNAALRNRPAPVAVPATAAPATTPAPGATTEPFAFPKFDAWEAKNPGKDYDDYVDARTDAREQWRGNQRRTEFEARQAVERQQRAEQHEQVSWQGFDRAQDEFRASTPDYDATLQGCSYPEGTSPYALRFIQQLNLQDPTNAPKILYYLGKNPDEATSLFQAPNAGALLLRYGQIQYAALRASGMSKAAADAATDATQAAAPAAASAASAPTAAKPSKPVSAAPAPITPVAGAANTTRTLHSLAEDSDDADDYIHRRREQLKRGG